MRSLLKYTAERALSSSLAATLARRRVKQRCLVLAYHGIVPDGRITVGERSLFVQERDFARQLDCLRSIADVVALSDIDRASGEQPRVAITFDDAYESALDEGVRALVERSLPATIFVAPGRLGGQVFWWDALAQRGVGVDDGLRSYALHKLGGVDERIRAWAAEKRVPIAASVPRYARTATVEKLREVVGLPGITVGSHSWSHPNLAALSYAEIFMELDRSNNWLRAEFGEKAIPLIAYPYGLDSEEVHRAAGAASYRGGYRIGGGWHPSPNGADFARPRLNIPSDLSLAGFKARVVGAIKP